MSTDNEVHGLTAGYAVNALTTEEQARAEEHLAECEDCHRDLAEFRATAVRLAYAEAHPPGEHVWRNLRSSVPNVRQLPPETAEKAPSRGPATVTSLSRRHRVLPWLVAAACLLLAVAMGG
ncbi:zf-HC2 domain-containing protein [Allosalinactinospora lopnorensis]|uniref:zf-HC2 domain-containing protein n=1 Tax=Allosalinactinospora lopnorensis TaxID=1352348 RepID=UPI003084692C